MTQLVSLKIKPECPVEILPSSSNLTSLTTKLFLRRPKLTNLPNLKKLHLKVAPLEGYIGYSNLTSLRIDFASFNWVSSFYVPPPEISRLSNLKELIIPSFVLRDSTVKQLSGLESLGAINQIPPDFQEFFPRVTHLTTCTFTDDVLKLTSLRSLRWRMSGASAQIFTRVCLTTLTNLTNFDYPHSNFTAGDLPESLTALKLSSRSALHDVSKFTNLTKLRMAGSLDVRSVSKLTNLTELKSRAERAFDFAINKRIMEKFTTLTNLTRLESWSPIQDEVIEKLPKLQRVVRRERWGTTVKFFDHLIEYRITSDYEPHSASDWSEEVADLDADMDGSESESG